MRPTKTERLDLSLRSAAGFSLVELMVVVTVIGALAVIGVPRFRTMMARARQAEAKTNLEQLHKLNTLHQTAKDRYAAWPKTDSVGYRGKAVRKCKIGLGEAGAVAQGSTNGACSQCTTDSDNNDDVAKTGCTGNGCKWVAHQPGAEGLGFILASCNSARYQYWIQHKVINGREYYHAAAYSPSDPDGRIFPTCNGKGSSTRDTALAHPSQGGNAALTIPDTTLGDQQSISEDKVFGHSDIVPACE